MFALTCFPPRWESASSAEPSRPGCRVRAVALAARADQGPAQQAPTPRPLPVQPRKSLQADPRLGNHLDILA
ncbi:MAG: hypothetical protein LCH41_13745 [Armatimonadetes bacterium]|nr:hypothetical protein [Armatimonadota bacterium]